MRPRTLLLTLAVALLALAGWRLADPFTFAPGSQITIEGTSNVRSWTCRTTGITGSADAATTAAGWTGLSALTVSVPVASVDCNNRTMNNHLRNAFNAAANPTVRFSLQSARVSTPRAGSFTVQATGALAMAGQSRPVTVTATGQRVGSGVRFTGSVPVTMSQWGMTPPRALAGTLRTGDRVTVRFDVTLNS